DPQGSPLPAVRHAVARQRRARGRRRKFARVVQYPDRHAAGTGERVMTKTHCKLIFLALAQSSPVARPNVALRSSGTDRLGNPATSEMRDRTARSSNLRTRSCRSLCDRSQIFSLEIDA